jgi:hypothetical protein
MRGHQETMTATTSIDPGARRQPRRRCLWCEFYKLALGAYFFPHQSNRQAVLVSKTCQRDKPAPGYCGFAGAPGSTAATPSGLMLKARKVIGSPPGFPHWCTSPNGS